jgi:hypothetical protein
MPVNTQVNFCAFPKTPDLISTVSISRFKFYRASLLTCVNTTRYKNSLKNPANFPWARSCDKIPTDVTRCHIYKFWKRRKFRYVAFIGLNVTIQSYTFYKKHWMNWLTSSHTSSFLTPGLRFIILSSAAFRTPSWVNSTFGFPKSPSTLTFLRYLQTKAVCYPYMSNGTPLTLSNEQAIYRSLQMECRWPLLSLNEWMNECFIRSIKISKLGCWNSTPWSCSPISRLNLYFYSTELILYILTY